MKGCRWQGIGKSIFSARIPSRNSTIPYTNNVGPFAFYQPWQAVDSTSCTHVRDTSLTNRASIFAQQIEPGANKRPTETLRNRPISSMEGYKDSGGNWQMAPQPTRYRLSSTALVTQHHVPHHVEVQAG